MKKIYSSNIFTLFLTRLAIKIYPKSTGDDENLIPIDPMTHSCYGAFQYQDNPDPGPFGTKRVVHKSDTPHDNIKKGRGH